jgi:HEAT repeat protein
MSYKYYKEKYTKYEDGKFYFKKNKLKFLFAPSVPKLKAKKHIKGLYKALKYDKLFFISREAANALADIGSDEAIEALKRALFDKKTSHCYNVVAEALGKIERQESLKALADALSSSDYTVRKYAADILGQAKNPIAVKPLIAAYPEDQEITDKNTRELCISIILALGQTGSKKSIPLLQKLITRGDYKIRETAFSALRKIGWTPGKNEEGAIYLCFAREWAKCALIGEQAIYPLIDALHRGESGSIKALEIIGGPTVIKALMETLENKESLKLQIRDKYYKPRVEEYEYKIIGREWVYAEIIKTLGRLRGKQFADYLIATLEQHPYPKSFRDSAVHLAAVETLGILGDKRAEEPLITALKNGIYEESVEALEKIGSKKIVESIIDALNIYLLPPAEREHGAMNRDDAASAIRRLGSTGDKRAEEPLITALKNGIYEESVEALEKIGSKKIVESIIDALNIYLLPPAEREHGAMNRDDAASAIRRLEWTGDERAVEPLSLALKVYDHNIPEAAARALYRIGGEKAVESLAEMLEIKGKYEFCSYRDQEDFYSPDLKARVREKIILCLIDIGDPKIKNILRNEIKYYAQYEVDYMIDKIEKFLNLPDETIEAERQHKKKTEDLRKKEIESMTVIDRLDSAKKEMQDRYILAKRLGYKYGKVFFINDCKPAKEILDLYGLVLEENITVETISKEWLKDF